jgi:cytochrome c peroxidase
MPAGRRFIARLLLAGAAALASAQAADLSPAAQLGRLLFFDETLSASGRVSCASCHDPANAYAAPPAAGVVMPGGTRADRPGMRTVPSLRYLADTPRFARHTYRDTGSEREDLGPAGGFMLDGRADSLQQQALLPLLDPAEMANASVAELGARLRHTRYVGEFTRVFGARTGDPESLAAQAAVALERFELEDPSFRPYDSRFDRSLRGADSLSAEERAGQRLFTAPAKGNCAACHIVTTGPGGRPPDFTDRSYHALGVPRNPAIPANRDARFFDLGLCGPLRRDLREARQYCGYFKTPTLRNVARRRFFFHNGRFTTLEQVVRFYVTRDTDAPRWYPVIGGALRRFDDLPLPYRSNVNISDAPLNREAGDVPALDEREIAALVAFLRSLDDAS